MYFHLFWTFCLQTKWNGEFFGIHFKFYCSYYQNGNIQGVFSIWLELSYIFRYRSIRQLYMPGSKNCPVGRIKKWYLVSYQRISNKNIFLFNLKTDYLLWLEWWYCIMTRVMVLYLIVSMAWWRGWGESAGRIQNSWHR